MLAIAVALVLAVGLGLLAQRAVHGGRAHDDPRAGVEGLPAAELLSVVRTLTALLLAFVLVTVFGSFQDAGDEAAAEAGAVLAMGEDAVLLTPDARRDVLNRLRCYALAVAGPEWRAQSEEGGLSRSVDAAADEISLALARANADPRNGTAVGAMLGSNGDRAQARILRVDEARPAVPDEVWTLLLVAVVVTVASVAGLGHPGVRGVVQLGVLVSTVLVAGLTLLVVHDLDRPYDGPARVDPTAMLTVERRIGALPDGGAPLPCDGEGRPL